jgi:fluoroquinolone resistance protein
MFESINEDKTFEKMDCSGQVLDKLDFVSCTFIGCNFSNGDLSQSNFMDCRFEKCNLSLVKMVNTGMKNIRFVDTRIAGVDFSTCNKFLFALGFEGGVLDYCSFYAKNLKRTSFRGCSIKESDFSEADLTECVFERCDLSGSIFRQTKLEKVDFRTALNYEFDPEMNKIKKAKFSIFGLPGLLGKYDIFIEG